MDECMLGAGCGLCFSRRLDYRPLYTVVVAGPPAGRPLTAGQWRTILGRVAKYERYPSEA